MRLLAPVEALYQHANALRRKAYRAGFLNARRLPRVVVSIGNVAVGGSGKTPASIAIARHLADAGERVAILSRGYGRSNESAIARVTGIDPRQFGDEPVLLHRALPAVPVVVGANRYAAGLWLLEREEVDIFVLDDGFQHLALARDVDVVIDDPTARYARESRSAVAYADLVLSRDGKSGFGFAMDATALTSGRGREPVDALLGIRVAAFSGIARNERFFDLLRSLGADVVYEKGFRDHHHYSGRDIDAIRRAADQSRADRIVTTEKDLVKIEAPDIAALQIEMTIEARFYAELDKRVEAARR